MKNPLYSLVLGTVVILATSLACSSAATPDLSAASTAAVETYIAELTEAQPEPAEGQPEAPQVAEPTEAPPPLPADTDTPEPTAGPQVAHVGDRAAAGGYIITVTNVETATQYGIWDAEPGKKYVAVELLIESEAASGVDVNTLSASLKDSDGYQYSETFGGKDPSIPLQEDLPIGEIMRGWITYEVPESAHGFTLIWEPPRFSHRVRILFDLGL